MGDKYTSMMFSSALFKSADCERWIPEYAKGSRASEIKKRGESKIKRFLEIGVNKVTILSGDLGFIYHDNLVSKVTSDFAKKAGIFPGMIIVRVNGIPQSNDEDKIKEAIGDTTHKSTLIWLQNPYNAIDKAEMDNTKFLLS